MAYEDMSPLSKVADEDLAGCSCEELTAEIRLFRKALRYCLDQRGDDHCWMDYRHLLMRFSPGCSSASTLLRPSDTLTAGYSSPFTDRATGDPFSPMPLTACGPGSTSSPSSNDVMTTGLP